MATAKATGTSIGNSQMADGRTTRFTGSKDLNDAHTVLGEEGAVPLRVVDTEAFAEYTRLSAHPILNAKSKYETSEGTIINLMKLPHHVRADIEHLPIKEQSKIMALKEVNMKIQNMKTGCFKRAYGVINKDGTTYGGKILSSLDLKRAELIELFGKMFTLGEVHEIVLKIWKLPIKKEALGDWRTRNQEAINARIEVHKREYSDVRLAYKRSRLEELTYLYTKRRRIYDLSGKGDDHRLLLATLAQIKQEVEGDLIRIDGALTMDIEATINNKMQETYNFINLKEIIIARVAAKNGLEVASLIKGISAGYYFRNLHADKRDDTTPQNFPSSQTYDFDKIARIQQQKADVERLEATKQADVKAGLIVQQTATSQSIKQLLIEKLKSKQGDINYTHNSLTGNFIDKGNR